MTASPSPSDSYRRIAGLAVLAGALIGALFGFVFGEPLQRWVFDAWQESAPREIAGKDVAVVLIDPLSLEAVGPWPWPRYYVARLIEAIAAEQPRVIGFDVLFAEPDALNPDNFASLYPELDPETAARVRALQPMDSVLAAVLGAAPIVLARVAVEADGLSPETMLLDPEVVGKPPEATLSLPQILSSIPEIDDVALGHAVVNGPPDDDGIVRRVPLTVLVGRRPMPGFAVELARIASGAKRIAWHGRALELGARRLPADKTGALPLRFGNFPEGASYSAAEVLGGKLRRGALAGKVVLVGMGAEGTADIVATPLSTEVVGVFVQAQAVDAILNRGWLDRPSWLEAVEWLAAALLVALAVFSADARRRRTLLIVAVALMAMLPVASWLAFDRANLLFDPLRPLLIGAGAAIALYVALFLITRAERARLAAELVDQRLAAAKQEGELQAARAIQLGMVPGPERLAALDPRVDIGAVLRPAKAVGGDFYDALMLGPDKLLFVIGDITGKGISAALHMALSKTLTRSVLSRERGLLSEAVVTLNRDLMHEADEALGLTMLIGVLDCASGRLSLVNAGHENPIFVRADGTVETLAMRGGVPFCVMADFPYPEESAQLAPGDRLVLITDGVTEAHDAENRMFGVGGVLAALAERPGSAAEVATSLADRVRAFAGETEPSDDLTIVALRWRGG